MNMIATVQPIDRAAPVERPAPVERREAEQPTRRAIGRVISCSGSRAVVAAIAGDDSQDPHWSIGSLISIATRGSRVVCFVCEIHAPHEVWHDGQENAVHITVELVGEVVDQPGGGITFRRGIRSYPHLGNEAHRIRRGDLQAIYDLGSVPGVEVGRLSQDKSIAATVSMEDLLRKHFAIVGSTGVGKSCAVSILVKQAVATRPNLRVVVVDPHNEYAAAFRGQSIALDSNTLDLPFWMFTFEEFSEAVFRGRKVSDGEVEFLRDAIVQAKGVFNQRPQMQPTSIIKRSLRADGTGVTADQPVPYRLSDIYTQIDEHLGLLEPRYSRADLRNLKTRLEALTNDARYRFMFGPASLEDTMAKVVNQVFRIAERDRPITVLQLAGIPSDVVNAVVSVVARIAFDIAVLSGGRNEFLIACEEAHRYVPEGVGTGFEPARRSLSRIAKEGRKYGCYLGVITQRPGELDQTILSQCSSLFAMRLANERDQSIIRAAIPDSSAGVLGFLSSIGNREAIAFGEALASPMRMTFAEQPREQLPNTAFYDPVGGGVGDHGANLYTLVDRLRR